MIRTALERIRAGVFGENPTFVQVIGLCPTLAVTTSAINGLGMGVAATAVLMGSNVVISMLRRMIPNQIRIPAFIVVIAGFVTIIQFLVSAYAPSLDKSLGIFIPLIVVNCIILARAEAFAFKNGVAASLFDGIGMGLGFTVGLLILGSIREVLGNGTIFGYPVFPHYVQPALVMILAPGGFLTLGLVMGYLNYRKDLKRRRRPGGTDMIDADSDADRLGKQTACGSCQVCSMLRTEDDGR
ncbi:MAG: electron transport complex subunit E [Thermanaerothrix sp.]|nr:electron transport complex subunit E [Thermanaerothrix sp.]